MKHGAMNLLKKGLKHSLVNGITDYIDADTEEARHKICKTSLDVIEGPLMAWHECGGRFIWSR